MSSLHNPDLDPSTLPAFRCAKCNAIAQSIMVGAERQWIGWCPDHGWTQVQRTEALAGRDEVATPSGGDQPLGSSRAAGGLTSPAAAVESRPASVSGKEAKDVTAFTT